MKPLIISTSQAYDINSIHAYDDSELEGFQKIEELEPGPNIFVRKINKKGKHDGDDDDDYLDRGADSTWDVKIGRRGSGKHGFGSEGDRIDYENGRNGESRRMEDSCSKRAIDPQYPDECSREVKFDLGWIHGHSAKPIKKQNLIRESLMGKRDIEYIRVDDIRTHEPSSKSKLDKYIKRSCELVRHSNYQSNPSNSNHRYDSQCVNVGESNDKWAKFAKKVKALRAKLGDEEAQRKLRRRTIRSLQGRTATIINGEIYRIEYPH